jgi:hypothetical protein
LRKWSKLFHRESSMQTDLRGYSINNSFSPERQRNSQLVTKDDTKSTNHSATMGSTAMQNRHRKIEGHHKEMATNLFTKSTTIIYKAYKEAMRWQ